MGAGLVRQSQSTQSESSGGGNTCGKRGGRNVRTSNHLHYKILPFLRRHTDLVRQDRKAGPAIRDSMHWNSHGWAMPDQNVAGQFSRRGCRKMEHEFMTKSKPIRTCDDTNDECQEAPEHIEGAVRIATSAMAYQALMVRLSLSWSGHPLSGVEVLMSDPQTTRRSGTDVLTNTLFKASDETDFFWCRRRPIYAVLSRPFQDFGSAPFDGDGTSHHHNVVNGLVAYRFV
jgi:hypothetical protein